METIQLNKTQIKKTKIEAYVRNVFQPLLGTTFTQDDLTGDLDLKDQLGISSIDIVDIVAQIEDYYDILIEDEEVETICSLDDIVNLISLKLTK